MDEKYIEISFGSAKSDAVQNGDAIASETTRDIAEQARALTDEAQAGVAAPVIWNKNCPLNHDLKKALSQVSPNFRKCSGIVLHDRSRKQTYDDPDEVDAAGLSELWTVWRFRCDTTR